METKLRIIDQLDKNKAGIHIRELSRLVKTSYNNTARNILLLENEKAIKKEKDANLVKIKLRNNPITIAYLKMAHTQNFLKLPKKASASVNEFLDELQEKPLIALIFGSYAKGTHTEGSDIDVLLVFQKIGKSADIENTAKRVGMRTNKKLSPVYVDYKSFDENFSNKHHDFSNEIRKDIIILEGLEHYYRLSWKFLE